MTLTLVLLSLVCLGLAVALVLTVRAALALKIALFAQAAELRARLETLVEKTNAVSTEANNLAGAIRGDSRATGEWGEIQLKRVLELAGLKAPESYSYQETFVDDATGRKSSRTDFVVKLPGERALIIDSKNTLEGLLRLHEATTPEARRAAVEACLLSVRRHVDEIDEANYPKVVPNAFGTVLMYIPVEEVYQLAMKGLVSVNGERELLRDYAARRNIVFVNSASVVPVVKLVEMMWSVEKSEKNREETIAAARDLLSRTNDFLSSFLGIGEAFKKVLAEYEAAAKRLNEGNDGQTIAKAAARLVKLGTQPVRRGGRRYPLAPAIESALREDDDA